MQKRQNIFENTLIVLRQKKFIALILTISVFFLPLLVLGLASATVDNAPEANKAIPEEVKDAGTAKKDAGAAKGNGSGPKKADNFKNKNGNVPGYLVKDINDAAKEAGLDPSILASQLDKESHFNPKAVSSVGAQGIAQFMPGTWQKYGNGGDAFNPHDAIAAQGRYLKALSDRVAKTAQQTKTGKDKLVLAAYNAGEGAVAQYNGIPPYQETQGYVEKILADTAVFI